MSVATDMVAQLETFLGSSAGVKSISVDGQAVTYDRKQALEELRYWQAKVSEETSGIKRKRIVSVNMRNVF